MACGIGPPPQLACQPVAANPVPQARKLFRLAADVQAVFHWLGGRKVAQPPKKSSRGSKRAGKFKGIKSLQRGAGSVPPTE